MKKLILVPLFLAVIGCNDGGDLQPAFVSNPHFSMPTGDINWHGGNWHHHKVPEALNWDRLSSDYYNEDNA